MKNKNLLNMKIPPIGPEIGMIIPSGPMKIEINGVEMEGVAMGDSVMVVDMEIDPEIKEFMEFTDIKKKSSDKYSIVSDSMVVDGKIMDELTKPLDTGEYNGVKTLDYEEVKD